MRSLRWRFAKPAGAVLRWAAGHAAEGIWQAIAVAVGFSLVGLIGPLRRAALEIASHRLDLALWQALALVAAVTAAFVVIRMAKRALDRRNAGSEPEEIDLSVTPSVLDIAGVGATTAFVSVSVTDKDGRPVANAKVDLATDRGDLSMQPSSQVSMVLCGWTDKLGRLRAQLHANSPWVSPGVATVTVTANCGSKPNLIATATATLIGPPEAIVVSASPTQLSPGEIACITATVKDKIGQNVCDQTPVSFNSSSGGTFSTAVAPTFGGVAVTLLLTGAPGVYTVVASTGAKGLPGPANSATVVASPRTSVLR